MGNRLDKATLDQVGSNNEYLIGEVSLKAPLDKSDNARSNLLSVLLRCSTRLYE